MKKIVTLFILILTTVMTFSQQPRFTEEQLAAMSENEFQAYQQTLKVEQRNKPSDIPSVTKLEQYANVGKVLGQAFKDCWSTVSTDAEKFAQSPAGKWTAFLITWKVMGKDAVDLTRSAVRWIVGIGLFVTVTPFLMFLTWRNCATRRIITAEKRTSIFNYERTYGEEEGVHSGYAGFYALCFGLFTVLTTFIMFV